MISNYFKVAWRNLVKGKLYSFINITGLAAGMAVAMLIGLWVWDELSFNQYHKNYDRIAQVWQFVTFDVEKSSYNSLPVPLASELRDKYPDFKRVSVSSYNRTTVLSTGDQQFSKTGMYVEPDFTAMMTPTMLAGNRTGLQDVHSILLSASLAKTLFGAADPMDKVVRLDNKTDARVTGVYEDFPGNSTFRDVSFLAPWSLFTTIHSYAKSAQYEWDENSFQIFVQLNEGADLNKVSTAIRDIRMKKEDPPSYKPEFFLHPMSRWHLHGDFKNGVNEGGLIRFVWLFGITGIFVLLLACINFMNLSTARSEKRAKEVGIRKTIGSLRSQLVYQFFSESVLLSFIALLLCLLLIQLALPFFNEVAGKKMSIPWFNPFFWLAVLGFSFFTGLIAGSYPALYLSSFRPVKVLKGTFRAGRFASLPRKALVAFQFTVSVSLMIGTIIVFRQINYAKNRPIGYKQEGLIEVMMNTPELYKHYEPLRTDLLSTGAVNSVSVSSGSITDDYGGTTAVSWKGKTPDMHPLLMSTKVSHDYGSTVGWQIVEGRDFSKKYPTDSAAMILNRSAVQLMGLKNPLNELIHFAGRDYRVIGVIDNMIKSDPFNPVKPSLFTIDFKAVNVINIKLAPQLATRESLNKIAAIFQKYNPGAPFDYKFVDELYADKFYNEERIGKLAGFFAILAVFISCLGLFGLASFMAEQRTKEIGVRKVLGASVLNIWQLLSNDFVRLVFIAFLVASPIAYYFMHQWLQNYQYRITISWTVFAITGLGALLLTLLVVSFQAIKAAIANPVKSLRSE